MRLYEYAVIFDGETDKENGGWKRKPELLIKAEVLANDESEAQIVAARAIPDAYAEELDRVTIAVRPF